jgi:lathosterol oxidase
MDIVLHIVDEYAADYVYNFASSVTGFQVLARDELIRQILTLSFVTYFGIFILYLLTAGISYEYLYDKRQMKHPKFLPNQLKLEIQCALDAFFPMMCLTVPFFIAEVRGYSKLYDNIEDYGIGYFFGSIAMFLLFTDFGIYWIHRILHHKWFYGPLHKLHHKWIVPTPFASHAFYFLDGYLQSIPYHIATFVFPMHKVLYIGLFLFVSVWSVIIHDGEYYTDGRIINGAVNHTIHHLYFNYNYGQYFTLWDRVFGTYRAPTEELFDKEKRNDPKVMNKTSKDVDDMVKHLEDRVKSTKLA